MNRRACLVLIGLLGATPWTGSNVSASPAAVRAVASPGVPVPPAMIAEWLGQSNVLAGRDFETTFTVKAPKVRADGITDPWDLSPPNLDAHETFRYVALGSRLHLNRTDASPAGRYDQTNVWADEAWTHRVVGDRRVSYAPRPAPGDIWSQGFIFNLIEGRYPSTVDPLDRHVLTGRTLDQSIEEGVLTHRFAVAGVPNDQSQYVLRIEVEPPHRLLEYTITVRAFDPAAETLGDIIVLQRYAVSEWREVEPGLWIPQVAELRGWRPTNPDPRGPAPLATHVRYERTGFTLIQDPSSVDAALFETPLPLGTSVHDERFNLRFRIGDTSLSLDGVVYELDQPILQHPGDALAELIRSAPPKIPADTEASVTPPATADEPPRTSPSSTPASTPTFAAAIDDDPRTGPWPRRLLVLGLLVAACWFILIGVHRRRLASSHA